MFASCATALPATSLRCLCALFCCCCWLRIVYFVRKERCKCLNCNKKTFHDASQLARALLWTAVSVFFHWLAKTRKAQLLSKPTNLERNSTTPARQANAERARFAKLAQRKLLALQAHFNVAYLLWAQIAGCKSQANCNETNQLAIQSKAARDCFSQHFFHKSKDIRARIENSQQFSASRS